MEKTLSETVAIKKISETDTHGVFEIEGLYKGYGITVGNALRRVLLSSIPGAAATLFKLRGVQHEFTTIPHAREDIVEIGLNLKKVRFRMHTGEPQVLVLNVKGSREVTAADFEPNALVEVVTPHSPIVTLTDKAAELEMEVTVERGMGYQPVDARQGGAKLSIGAIALDAAYSPVIAANFSVQHMRVGERADYNRLALSIETDGSLTPSLALQRATKVLEAHFAKLGTVVVKEPEPIAAPAAKGRAKRAKAKPKAAKKSKKTK